MRKSIRVIILAIFIALICSSPAFAEGISLDDVGTKPTTPLVDTIPLIESPVESQSQVESQATKDSPSKTVADLFSNAGLTEESVQEAQEIVSPLAKVMNSFMAILLGLLSLALLLTTLFDLVYIAIPALRPLMSGDEGQPQAYPHQPMGMGDPSKGMVQTPQYTPHQNKSVGYRLISDEAIAATMEAQSSLKILILSYMKKRTFFLVLFALAVILFTSSVFTDIGVKFGTLILNWFFNLM